MLQRTRLAKAPHPDPPHAGEGSVLFWQVGLGWLAGVLLARSLIQHFADGGDQVRARHFDLRGAVFPFFQRGVLRDFGT